MSTKVEVKQGGGAVSLILVVVIVGLSLVLVNLYKKLVVANGKVEDFKQNVEVLKADSAQSEQKIVKLNDSLKVMVSTTQSVYVTMDQYRRLYRNEYEATKKLTAKYSDLQTSFAAYSQSSDTIYLERIVTVPGRDSIAPYRSKWIDIDVRLRPPSVVYHKRDSLAIFHTIVQKSALWGLIKYGKKSEQFNTVSFDPKTKIIGFKVIEIVR